MYDKTQYDFSPLLDDVLGHDLGLVPDVEQYRLEISAPPPQAPSRRPMRMKPGAVPSPSPAAPSLPPGTISHGLSGFGRRNSLLLVYIAAFVLANRDALKKQGLRLHFTIFEKQGEDEAGSGYSCQTKSDGGLNTGLPGQVEIPTVDWNEIVRSTDLIKLINVLELTNLARCVGSGLQSDMEGHKQTLRETNLAALAMFVDATNRGVDATNTGVDVTETGVVETAQAFTTRGAVGTIQQPKILNVLKYIENNMADLITIEKKFRHEVIGLDLQDPKKPKLKVQSLGPKDPMSQLPADDFGFPDDPPMSNAIELVFDFIHLSNGTPWRSPVPNLQSSERQVFSRIPNLQNVGAFLEHRALLENRGTSGSGEPPEKRVLKAGSRIGITGFSLSAYDFIPMILQHTSILRPTPSGYEIIEQEAEKYQGLLTFISRTGIPTPPRHIITNPAGTINPPPILTTKEVHAMLLQRNFQWLQFWKVFLDANVARSLQKLPKDLHYKREMTPEDRMKDYVKQTDDYNAGRLTEVGLLRAGYWSIFGGQGFEKAGQDLDNAERELVEMAPLTRKERAGYLLRRAPLSDITNMEHVRAGNPNTDFFHEYGIMHNTIASSPPKIHYLIGRLFELGVAKHVKMDFKDIKFHDDVKPTDDADLAHIQALFAPLSLDRGMDMIYKSLVVTGEVAEVVRGQPEYAKGRFLKSRNGELVHAMDMGMGGGGSLYEAPDGVKSKVGMRWPDTTFLDAAVDGAPTAAVMAVLLSSYAQQESIKNPVDHLLEEYKRGLPTSEEYEKEVRQFKSVWEEMYKKHAFLQLCEKLAQDGSQYAEYTDNVFEEVKRNEFVEDQANTGALLDYRKAVDNIPPFTPPTIHDYFERFVDFSPSEITRCWTEHRKWIEGRNSL